MDFIRMPNTLDVIAKKDADQLSVMDLLNVIIDAKSDLTDMAGKELKDMPVSDVKNDADFFKKVKSSLSILKAIISPNLEQLKEHKHYSRLEKVLMDLDTIVEECEQQTIALETTDLDLTEALEECDSVYSKLKATMEIEEKAKQSICSIHENQYKLENCKKKIVIDLLEIE